MVSCSRPFFMPGMQETGNSKSGTRGKEVTGTTDILLVLVLAFLVGVMTGYVMRWRR